MSESATYHNAPMVERRTSPWGWIIPLLIVAAAIAAYVYYHNRNTTPQTTQTDNSQTTASSTTQPEAVKTNTDLSTATAGTKAQLSNIAINQVVSSRIFTIKSGTQTIYTILSPNVNLPAKTTLQAGQQVAITGTLLSTNSDQFKAMELSAAEKSALANQSLVLMVDQVTISGSNATTNPDTTTP